MSFISGTFNSMRRWYNNDNRVTSMNEIYNIIQASFANIETVDLDLERRYRYIFPQVIDGIKNYMRTYGNDVYITSRCQIIIDNINTFQKKDKTL